MYAVPFTTDAGLLYSRTDLGVQPLRSWAELAAGRPDRTAKVQYTLATQLQNYEGLTVNALEAIWDAGGHFMDNGAILDQRARAGLTNLVKAVVTGHGAVGSTDFKERGSLDAFRSKQAAFMRNWPYARDLIPTTGANAIQFDVRQLPWPSVLGGWSLVVTSSSSHPVEAIDLIKFLTSYDNEEWVFQQSGLPVARPKVYDDPRVQARSYIRELKSAIDSARPRPTTPYYLAVTQVLRATMWDLLGADHFDPAVVNQKLDGLEKALRAALQGR